jgi:anti-anti-sigma factor
MMIDHQIAGGCYMLIVNLNGVDYISSIGWGVFISNLKELREHGGDVVLTNMNANVRNIFELMELSSIIKSFDEVDKAVTMFLGTGQETVPKQKVVGAETGDTETKAHRAAKEPVKRVQPVYEESRPASPKPAASKSASPKPAIKISHSQVNRPVRRPAPIELVSENTVSLDLEKNQYTKEHLLEKHIVKVILDRPYYSVGKITKALRLAKYGAVKQKKRTIKRELIKLGLEHREDRYEFALRNRR